MVCKTILLIRHREKDEWESLSWGRIFLQMRQHEAMGSFKGAGHTGLPENTYPSI